MPLSRSTASPRGQIVQVEAGLLAEPPVDAVAAAELRRQRLERPRPRRQLLALNAVGSPPSALRM
jgi:hypothetical protein